MYVFYGIIAACIGFCYWLEHDDFLKFNKRKEKRK